ncbi:MAG TPA: MFS transporter, partial [Chryseolinea sp.]|nr:MFS transporter [Chryseolinea sp.]
YQGKLKDLFIPRMFKLLLIGIMIGIFQQITGINVIMYYAPTIFRFAGFGTDSALLQTVLMGIVNMVFAIASMFFVDKLGRRPLMIIGSAGMGLCLLALAVIFIYPDIHRFFVLGSIMGFLAFFGFSLGPVVWVIISEIFPNKLRSYAVAVTVFFIWASNFIVSLSFPYLLANLGGHSFFIFSFMCFLCVLFVVKYLKETKGKTLERIEYELTEA